MADSGLLADDSGKSLRDVFREAFISGLAVMVPVLITVIVLTVAVNYVYTYLDLFSDYLKELPLITVIPGLVFITPETLIEIFIPVALLWAILFIGLVVNSSDYGELAVDYFDAFIARIPGVGSVYESFRQMSDVMLESDTQNFREVKLVEFPHEGAYTLGFVTTETPESLRRPTGHGRMLTLFLPLAPNPVMGGHLVHVPAEKVMDVDMTVEEGIRAVVTSGVGVAGASASSDGLSPDQLAELGAIEHADQQFTPEQSSPDVRRRSGVHTERTERYDERVSPESASTPEDIVRREYDAVIDGAEGTPEEIESDAEPGVNTDRTPEDIELNTSRETTEVTPEELQRRHERAADGATDDAGFDTDRPTEIEPAEDDRGEDASSDSTDAEGSDTETEPTGTAAEETDPAGGEGASRTDS